MKIVFIGPFGLQPKGTMSVRALPLARALVQRGHAVTILIPPWDDPARAGRVWADAGVQVVNVPLPAPIPLFFHIWLTRTLVAQAVALRPDVIHFFKPKAFAGLAHVALWALRQLAGDRLPVRLVLDADDWEQAWNAVLPYQPWQKKFFAWQEQWGLRHADAVTVASRQLSTLAEQVRGQPSIFYAPNGGQPALQAPATAAQIEAARQTWQLGPGPVVLLYSRLAEFGLERIVSLVRRVAQHVPAARWLVVGQGLHGEHTRLADLLRQAGQSDRVIFTGWLPAENLPAMFAVAGVAAFPYDNTLLNRTKCSVKLIDLLGAGVPVVADAVGQNCEYIESGVSGVLVQPEDDAAFGVAIIALLQSPEQRRQLGQAAALQIKTNFDWLHLAAEVERAYR